jgi:D-alanyl-lipoteichoic acid acyltransferase DltB (MBOAT superfamily)
MRRRVSGSLVVMLFHSQVFILGFLPACLGGFFLLGRLAGPRTALCWLVGASLVFYGWWNPAYVPLLAGSIAVNYALGRHIRRSAAAKAWFITGITLNLAVLGWFKYADFLLHIVDPAAPGLTIILPLAISFFTFQQRT